MPSDWQNIDFGFSSDLLSFPYSLESPQPRRITCQFLQLTSCQDEQNDEAVT